MMADLIEYKPKEQTMEAYAHEAALEITAKRTSDWKKTRMRPEGHIRIHLTALSHVTNRTVEQA